MNISLISGIIFVVVFAGIILLHELGHYAVARLLKIDVEEFGFGIPPRMIRLWRGRGSLWIGDKTFTIPVNFKFPFDPAKSLDRDVLASATPRKGKLILRHIKFAAPGDNNPPAVNSNAEKDRSDHSIGKSTGEQLISIAGKVAAIRLGTEFTLNWIPFGGFNKVRGEEDPGIPGGFASASAWKRIAVFLAGASMNLLTAVVVYAVLFNQIGVPDRNTTLIAYVDSPSPAEQAGIQAGDIVLAAGGSHITGYSTLTTIIHENLGSPLLLVILRQGETLEITVTPRVEYPSDQGPMGVGIGQPLVTAGSWTQIVSASFRATWQDINSLLSLPGRIIAGTISPEAAQIGGPRSVWNLFQQAVSRDITSRQPGTAGEPSQPTNYTLLTIISLTVTVAVANLLPIPALDGGRIFMSLPEIILRRKIPARFQAALNGIGFVLLLSLLAFFYVKDLINPVDFTLP